MRHFKIIAAMALALPTMAMAQVGPNPAAPGGSQDPTVGAARDTATAPMDASPSMSNRTNAGMMNNGSTGFTGSSDTTTTGTSGTTDTSVTSTTTAGPAAATSSTSVGSGTQAGKTATGKGQKRR